MSEFDSPNILSQPSLPPIGNSYVRSWSDPVDPAALKPGEDVWGAGTNPEAADSWAKLGHLFVSSHVANTLDAQGNGAALALQPAIAQRNEAVKAATGETLEDPTNGGYRAEAMQRLRASEGNTVPDPSTYSGGLSAVAPDAPGGLQADQERTANLNALQVQIYQEHLNDLQRRFPNAGGLGLDINTSAQMLANKAVSDAQAAYGATGGGLLPWLVSMAGGASAAVRDPLQLGALFYGGGEATAFKSVAGQMFETFFRQGAVNAGVQAASEPAVQAWRADRGQESGVKPALNDIGMAFLFGGAIGAGVHGLGAAFKSDGVTEATALAERAAKGDPAAAAALEEKLPANTSQFYPPELSQALKSIVADHEAAAGAPPGIPPEIVGPMLRDAARGLEHPDAPLFERPWAFGAPSNAAGDLVPDFVARARLLNQRLEATRAEGVPATPMTRVGEAGALLDRADELSARLEALPPGDQAASERLARLQVVESQAANAETAAERQAMMSRRDELLTDTTPEALRAAAAPIEARRTTEAELSSIRDQLKGLGVPEDFVRAIRATDPDPLEHDATLAQASAMGARNTADVRAVASDVVRARKLPESASRLLSGEEAPPARNLEMASAPTESAQAPGETEGEGARAALGAPVAPRPLNDPVDDLFGPNDLMRKTPVVRDGALSFVAPEEIGASSERQNFMAQLIENCIL